MDTSPSNEVVNAALFFAVVGVGGATLVFYFLSRLFERHRKGTIQQELEDLESAFVLQRIFYLELSAPNITLHFPR